MRSTFGALFPGTSASIRHRVTDADLNATAELTGDCNPIHCDIDAARQFGQSRRVAHGVFLLGLISRLIGTRLPGPGSIWFGSEIEFLAPVHTGDEVEAVVSVQHVSQATNVVVLDVKMLRLPDKTVLKGKAKVILPMRASARERPMEFKEMTAVVTGGTRGIGEAIARKLAANGTKVIVNFKQDDARAKQMTSEIGSLGGTVHAIKADISVAAEVQKLYEKSVAVFGKIDVIVNNATPAIRRKSLLETQPEEFTEYFNTYVMGAFELVRLALPGMRERKFGRVINILTSALSEVPPKMGAYITAKSALHGLSRAMAVEFGPWGINVNMVSPSTVIGHHTDDLGVGAQELIARKVPLRRLCEPEEVADLVLFLVSRSSSYIAGANIPVTGGMLQG